MAQEMAYLHTGNICHGVTEGALLVPLGEGLMSSGGRHRQLVCWLRRL